MLSQKERLRARGRNASKRPDGELLSALVEAADPHSPPSEEEILSLILGELSSVCNRWIRPPLSKQR